MSEKYAEALDELRQLANEFHERADEVTYGFFCGGDPHTFSPDPEASTAEERAAHAAACDRWAAGDRTPVHMPHCSRGDMTKIGFGLGSQVLEDPVYTDAADRLARILDRLESE